MNLKIGVKTVDFNAINLGYKKVIELGMSKNRNQQMCWDNHSGFGSCKTCQRRCYGHGTVSNKFRTITIVKGVCFDENPPSMDFEVLGVSLGSYSYLIQLGERL